MPLASGVQALAVDNLLYNLSVEFFISSGACVMLLTYDLPVGARLPLIAIAAGMTLCTRHGNEILMIIRKEHVTIEVRVDVG